MTPERWRQLSGLYRGALERDAPARAEFLDEACAGDEALRREVESLLTQEESADQFVRGLVGAAAADVLDPPSGVSLIGRHVGGYEIRALIGAGGMGEVYRARDVALARDVAVKILPRACISAAGRLARFEQEARVLASLSHPNVGAIYGVEVAGDIHALILELIDGDTLAERIRGGRLTIPDALRIARQIADALDAAHQKGIVHRDLKPANIKITGEGVVKVLDFGLAKVAAPVTTAAAHATTVSIGGTREGVVLGTAAYMSPEQARGRPVDKRTDIWAFGCVLYEMLTGRSAFGRNTASDTIAAVLDHEPDWSALPSAPPVIDRLLRRCLEKNARRRLHDIADARLELDDALLSDVSASRDRVASRAGRLLAGGRGSSSAQTASALVKRHPGMLVAGGLAIVLAGGIYSGRVWWTQPVPTTPALEDLQIVQLTTSGNAERPAISPDGKYVAYVQRDGNDYSLWIRQTATASHVQIVRPETGVAVRAATVTPDGNFVDFVRHRIGQFPDELWRVPFLGGTPKRLVDNVDGPVGWSPDGRQLAFVRTDRRFESFSLISADPDGGHERTIASRRSPAYFTSLSLLGSPVVRPAWSPDGRVIALPGNHADADEVVFVDVASGSERTVALSSSEDVRGLAWFDKESLVLNRPAALGAPQQLWWLSYPGGKLSRVTNDLSSYDGVSLTAGRSSLVTARLDRRVSVWVGDGEARGGTEVVAPIPYGTTFPTSVAWAGDRLLYGAVTPSGVSIASVVPGRGTTEQIVARGSLPAATSDGGAIVFTSTETGDHGGLWKVDADGRHARQLVPGDAFSAVVTLDDRGVIFLSGRSGVESPWVVSIDGGTPTQVVNMHAGPLDLSPDGQSLMFSSRDDQGQSVIIMCDLPVCAGRRSVAAPASVGNLARWTPDGRAIAYIRAGGPPVNIWVQPLDGSAARQLTRFTDDRAISDFAWSRGGARLAVVRDTVANDVVVFGGLRPKS